GPARAVAARIVRRCDRVGACPGSRAKRIPDELWWGPPMGQPRWATSIPFRLAVCTLALAVHLLAFLTIGDGRMHLPWNREPVSSPAFDYADQPAPSHWNRILVSRWDSQHYIDILERGYTQCPPEDLRGASLNPYLLRCGFNFYPGYAVVGHFVQ